MERLRTHAVPPLVVLALLIAATPVLVINHHEAGERHAGSPQRARTGHVAIPASPGRLVRTLAAGGLARSVAPRASADQPTQHEVKAALLYKFAKFIEWPASAFADSGSPLVICIAGDDLFGAVLDRTVTGKTVHDRRLIVRRLPRLDNPAACHMLFVSGSEDFRALDLLEAARRASVVTIGESERFARAGGIITLFLEQWKVRFGINVKAAERARLSISSKLLSLAKVVERRRRSHEGRD